MFKGVLRVFKGCVKGIPNVFEGCSMGVSRLFNSVSVVFAELGMAQLQILLGLNQWFP